jgi:toxin CcdB
MPTLRHTACRVQTYDLGEHAMAQYDVYANPSSSAANGIPFVVVLQSDLLNALPTRLTIPLAAMAFAGKVPTSLCPIIAVNGQHLHALAHYAAPLPAKLLKRPVDHVAAQASALVAAMDAVLSGI